MRQKASDSRYGGHGMIRSFLITRYLSPVTRHPSFVTRPSLLVTIIALGLWAGWAEAQVLRRVVVTVPLANLRAEPSSTAPVVTQVPKGTVLEVLEERGTWLKVQYRHPERGLVQGYIAARLVEPIPEGEPVPPPEKPAPPKAPPPKPPGPEEPPPPRPPAPAVRPPSKRGPEAGFWSVRLLVGLNPGVADGYDQTVSDQLSIYFEPVSLDGRYHARVAPVVGLGVEYRLKPRLGVGLEGEFMLGKAKADLTAQIPHPLLFNQPRPSEASDVGDFTYRKFGGSLYAAYSVNSTLSVLAGLSVYALQFESVTGLEIQESGYPYDDPPTITGVVKESGSGTAFGGFAGLSLSHRLSRRITLEVQPRLLFATGSPTGPLGEEIKPKAVSFWVLAGLRFRL